jgi:hypothetical protein
MLGSDPTNEELIGARILQWKAGMEAANRFALMESRRQTPEERLRNHQTFLGDHARIGLAIERPQDRLHYVAYHELQERFIAGRARRQFGN